MLCPCQSQHSYENCCGPFINGTARPQTPEQLMRSRYTAYTQANMDYIGATMRGQAAIGFDPEQTRTWAQSVEWLGLEVIHAPHAQAAQGVVEFIAHYRENGAMHKIHEVSEFARLNGGSRWFYIAGKAPKVERNVPCPCGSGKKYKRCCGL
ncbi:MAG TPA: YchJ family protein [Gammaproteobacteria bacterium]|nr:YchJ family protein [Gammaproteobacteria bacterium]